jgi:hypothetical protein
MAEHDTPQQPSQQPPEDEVQPERQAGDRPAPTPGHIGNLPDDAPGLPVAFPPQEPR